MKVKEIIKFTEWMPNPQQTGETARFSIMMPTYRRFASGHLTRAIQSVLNQTNREFELIMIDDGSVDGSFDEIQRMMKLDPRIHCLHHPRNVGLPAIGCYEALLRSRGEYLMFCFDDTEYQKDALERVDQYVSEHKPKISFGYIDYQYQDSDGTILQSFLGKDKISQARLKMTNFLPNLGAILHRDVPNEIGFLDPHLAVARMTDWDYWKRAANVYELHYTGIHIGTEFGLVTNNSLGLTYPLNPWMAYEWTESERSSTLTPDNYEEYEIQHIPDDLSDQSKLALRDLSRFYKDKFWYQPQQPLLLSDTEQAREFDKNLRILVVTRLQDASVTLTFEYIPGIEQNIRFTDPTSINYKEVMGASAIIISRHLFSPEVHRWVEIARQLGIPHYYYLDDNFIVLSKEILELSEYTEANMRAELASFHGVLVSSPKLVNFFSEHNIHSKIHLFPPTMPAQNWLDHLEIPEKAKDTTRIGFMGGAHRQNDFTKFVLPAIARLAKDHAVELVIGGNHRISIDDYPKLKIYQFPYDTSYRLALGRMQSANIDILIHSGSATQNNPYKTHNILLNAWALKAIPVLSNQPPYENIKELGLGILCEATDVDEWHKNLEIVMSNSELTAQLQENLHQYVTENYSGKQNLEVLKVIDQECLTPGIAVIENRFRVYLDIVERGISRSAALNPVLAQGGSWLTALLRRNRSWLLPTNSLQERLARFIYRKLLSFLEKEAYQSTTWNPLLARGAVRILQKLDYTLRPQTARWDGIEFMIGTHNQNTEGQLNIEILDKTLGTTIRLQKIELHDLEDNQIVQVKFDEIRDSKDKDFTVRFSLETPGPEAIISIYEENDTESVIRRIPRRLGLLTHGNILACRLLYASD